MPIQSAAIFHVDHVRSLMVVGARSLFHRGLPERSLRSSSKSLWVTAISESFECGIQVSIRTLAWPTVSTNTSGKIATGVGSLQLPERLLKLDRARSHY